MNVTVALRGSSAAAGDDQVGHEDERGELHRRSEPRRDAEGHRPRADPAFRPQVPGDEQAENEIDLAETHSVEHRVQRQCREEQQQRPAPTCLRWSLGTTIRIDR